MLGKQINTVKVLIIIWIFSSGEFTGISQETCDKIDDCSCKKSNGRIINLREIDGGSKAAFKNIPTVRSKQYTFDWNPCTSFSENSECLNMLMCQKNLHSTDENNPCAQKTSKFKVNKDGTTTIIYQSFTDSKDYKRSVEITLKCDESQYPGNTGSGVTERYEPKNSAYTMVFTSRCACDNGCDSPSESGSSKLSIGSILLIVFFALLLFYLIAGVLIKRYKMGVESVPEVIPNYEFWAGIPSLVKDGVIFTCQGVRSGCSSLYQRSSKSGYDKI